MSQLSDRVKISILVHGNGLSDAFKNNSLYFLDLYNKSIEDFKTVPTKNIFPGGFYFFHYLDKSNWLKYSPVFIAGYKKLSDKIIILAINLNFIPLQIRVLLFDKFITEKDFENDKNDIYLKVDYEGVYNELRKLGFEYALMEFDASRVELAHKVSLLLLPRFLYHQHPINKYDPGKLMQIWEAKIEKREQRHKEMTLAILSDFYDVNSEISDKYDVLRGHIQRIRRNMK
jgi:hypothetical protein